MSYSSGGRWGPAGGGVGPQEGRGVATHWFSSDGEKYDTLATSWVLPEPRRCVQCGVCSFNCPMGIDVRRHVWNNEPVVDAACLACGECVKRCPRGLLRFEPIADGATVHPEGAC